MKNSLITLFLLHLVYFGFAQMANLERGLGYEVYPTYKKPIPKETVHSAKTMSDLNPGFPTSWINRYISVNLSANSNGIVKTVSGKNDVLNKEQMDLLQMTEIGTDITVDIQYQKKNALQEDTAIRTINFSYTIAPKIEAQYPGGYFLLKEYLKENAIDKIAKSTARQIKQATINFIVNEDGQITDIQLSKTSTDEQVDQLLLQTICNMPKWIPAEDAKGVKVKQEFILNIGNEIGC